MQLALYDRAACAYSRIVRNFEAELQSLVIDFAERLVELASLASRAMVDHALDIADSRKAIAPEDVRQDVARRSRQLDLGSHPRFATAVREFKRQLLAESLAAHHGNMTHAARTLGIARTTLQRYARQVGVK